MEEFNTIKEKISINDWNPNEAEAKLLLAIKDCNAPYRALRVAICTSAISPESFGAYVHHNMLEFQGSFIMNENYERTCASSVVIPIVRQIFKRNVELSTKWFERQSQFTNKHHFDAVISIDSVKLNSDMHNKIIHKRRMRASLSNGYL